MKLVASVVGEGGRDGQELKAQRMAGIESSREGWY
jgi:hypothetical protein